MGNRVLLGKRDSSDFGLFISRSGVDVANTSLTSPLAFDSGAASTLNVHSFGQGILTAFNDGNGAQQQSISFGGVTYTSETVTITHNLGYVPAYAVRWNRFSDLSSGVPAAVYTPHIIYEEHLESNGEDGDEEEFDTSSDSSGGCSAVASTSTIVLENNNRDYYNINSSTTVNNSAATCYAYIIFKQENTRSGGSF
jgi:hypothetical protein